MNNSEFIGRVFRDALFNVVFSVALYFVAFYIPGWFGSLVKWLFILYCAVSAAWNVFFVVLGIVPAVMLVFGKGSVADEASNAVASLCRLAEAASLAFLGLATWNLVRP